MTPGTSVVLMSTAGLDWHYLKCMLVLQYGWSLCMRIDKIDIYKTLNDPLLHWLSPLPCMRALYQLYTI